MIARIEKAIVVLLFAGFYFGIFVTTDRPVFLGEFNSLDGSIYAVRLMDLLGTLLLFGFMSYHLVPEVLDRGRVRRFILLSFALLIVLSGFEYLLDRALILLFNLPASPNEFSDKMLTYRDVKTIHSTIVPGNEIVYAISLLYGLSRDWIVKFQQRREMEQHFLRAELDHLRSQINPHFLFNTLNSIYAMARRNRDQETGDAVLQLSGIMRYMLHESNVSSVSLTSEIEQIRNFLNLVKLRYAEEDPFEIVTEIEVERGDIQVAPLLLMPFVENAVKHGLNRDGKGFVHITLCQNQNGIEFEVVNSIHKDPGLFNEHSGIGLDNVRRRLLLLYPDSHSLVISSTSDRYHVRLTLTPEVSK